VTFNCDLCRRREPGTTTLAAFFSCARFPKPTKEASAMAMTVEQKKAMRGLIYDLLLSPPVQKIDFDFAFSHGYGFNRHKVDGWGFAHVALLLTTPLGIRF
jgi:hypothetical protein